ncbi:MAG: uroporphyrinogen decarboxylase family protein [Armatimonadota bacterium]
MKPSEMTGRERLLRTFRREPVDRIPVAPFLYYNSIYEMFDYEPQIDTFYDPPDFDPITKYVEFCGYFGFDVLHVMGSVWDQYLHSTLCDRSITESDENWDVSIVDEGDEASRHRVITIRTPDGNLTQVEDYKKSSKYLVVQAINEHLIKTLEDFEILRKYLPPADKMDLSFIRRARAAVGDKGLVDTNNHGAFNILSMFRKLDDIMVDPILDEGFYREMMEFFMERQILRIGRMVEAGGEVIEIAAQLATSMVGADFYRKYVLDYEKRLVKAIHDAGAFVTLHNCGDAAKIMHLYNELDIDCWGYLTPPPFGDVDLDEALEVMNPDLVLKGNIDQVEFMRSATPDEVREKVRDLIVKVKPRGNFILSTTDFLFDGTPYENIRAFAEAGIEYGRY